MVGLVVAGPWLTMVGARVLARRARAAGVLVLSSCGVHGLSFYEDDRVSIRNPADNETVELPLRVVWDAEGFDGSYGLFFDQSPMRPGQSLDSLVPDDDPCRVQEDCPDAEWLADEDVYVSRDTEIVVDELPDRRATNRSNDRHELTIVLLDDTGRRVGEAAFVEEFIVDRPD